jgi:hypothetical protein
MRKQRNSGCAGNQKSIITEWSRRSLVAISGTLKATLRHQRSNSGYGGNRQSVITSGAVGELERMRIEVPNQWTDAVDSRAWPEVRHVDQTVYGLASVNG